MYARVSRLDICSKRGILWAWWGSEGTELLWAGITQGIGNVMLC
jgi:hypothetical protein